ncbi:tyrosine-type recombinase/integrase [Streptomyces sp. e14]|uniref:tyrosine-type recombinase/integrase n=1 Tax=Streptomyces sp. e14 TaxID=645465 RepID=UPI00030D9159|nr:tyrosine-type recombinase/integrase [Streptomyces sp. e14]
MRGAVSELTSGQRVYKAPKSAAGKRLVAVPASVLPLLITHMKVFAESGADGRVFVGAKKATPRRNHFNRLWHKACADAGVKGLRFHDLRHTGNTLVSRTNASTKELMARLGHSTARAALIYQHANYDREREIADAVDEMIVKAFKRGAGRNGHVAGTDD